MKFFFIGITVSKRIDEKDYTEPLTEMRTTDFAARERAMLRDVSFFTCDFVWGSFWLLSG